MLIIYIHIALHHFWIVESIFTIVDVSKKWSGVKWTFEKQLAGWFYGMLLDNLMYKSMLFFFQEIKWFQVDGFIFYEESHYASSDVSLHMSI